MPYLAVNKNGTEVRFDGMKRTLRDKNRGIWMQLVIRRDYCLTKLKNIL
jgi:hypothetical protein